MADGIPPNTTAPEDDPVQPAAPEPPPLDAIRIKGPSARGLNKKAILAAAGGGVAIVLVLASGAFSSAGSRKPAETKPMMSDPARPEMAKGAIRALPADYTQAAALAPLPLSPTIPQLGPPLPGDVAAFADQQPELRGRTSDASYDWSAEPPPPVDPGVQAERDEYDTAQRSGIFFALRNEGDTTPAAAPQAVAPVSKPALTAITAATDGQDQRDRLLFTGAIIPASLVTELNSESPGPVIAQVTQSIYDSATGRTLLIPQGARLIGGYKSSTRYGQSRVAITWSRLIMPDGTEISLDEAALSPDGAAGINGEVDNHFGDIFGAALLGTVINVGVATTEDPQLTFSGIGAVSRDPVDAAIADGVQRSASAVTNRVVDRGLSIPPTICVPAGARISVIVTRRSRF